MATTLHRRREVSLKAFARRRLDELERERAQILAAYPGLLHDGHRDANATAGRSARGIVRAGARRLREDEPDRYE